MYKPISRITFAFLHKFPVIVFLNSNICENAWSSSIVNCKLSSQETKYVLHITNRAFFPFVYTFIISAKINILFYFISIVFTKKKNIYVTSAHPYPSSTSSPLRKFFSDSIVTSCMCFVWFSSNSFCLAPLSFWYFFFRTPITLSISIFSFALIAFFKKKIYNCIFYLCI